MTSKFSIENRELLQRISSGEAVVGIDFGNLIVRELAAFRLAAMDSEPAIIVGDDGGDALAYRRLIQSFEPGTKLYRHAQPAQVVPDGYVMVPKEPTEEMLQASYREAAVYSPTAYRAMIAAAKHDTPAMNSVQSVVTVPGKWIPVSERMPELGEWLVTDGCDFDVQLFNGEQFIPGFVWEDKITHWMPLPAAPQEAQGE